MRGCYPKPKSAGGFSATSSELEGASLSGAATSGSILRLQGQTKGNSAKEVTAGGLRLISSGTPAPTIFD